MEVALVNGRGIALVDDEDARLVEGLRWYLHSGGYACGPGGTVLMHRLIMGEPSGPVDHRDGNRLNNRRSNLRVTDYSLNAFNRSKVDKRSKSGVPGVHQRPDGKFYAYIFHDGKRIYLGSRPVLLEAAGLRASAELERYGEITPALATAIASITE